MSTAKPIAKPWRRAIVWSAVVVIVAVALVSTRYVNADAVEEAVGDPALVFHDTVVPAMADSAAELPVLLDDLANDAQAAISEHGVPSDSGLTYFTVRANGSVTAIDEAGNLSIAIEGVPADVPVVVQSGPIIAGTALRDATGLLGFNEFTNQIEYLDMATALNSEMVSTLFGEVPGADWVGTDVAFVGAFSFVPGGRVQITPSEWTASS